MLYNIVTGYRGIPRRPQDEMIYFCIKVDSIAKEGIRFVFTNGYATDRLTEFYQSLEKLDQVDWDVVKATYWNNTEDDWDRQRRKQAEFLVYERVGPDLIDAIVVLNQEKADAMRKLASQYNLAIPVHIDTKGTFYYQ